MGMIHENYYTDDSRRLDWTIREQARYGAIVADVCSKTDDQNEISRMVREHIDNIRKGNLRHAIDEARKGE